MQPIQINVSVSIGVSQELQGLLMSLFNRQQIEAETAAPAQRKQTAAKPRPVVEKASETAEGKTPESQPEAAAPTEQQPPENKDRTEVDVRAAMDKTRKRIEGENYKEQTDSEGYKKWHRALTGWFKMTAAIYGAEKPSALPDSESRCKFIAHCDAVYVKDDELVEDCPY